MEATNGAASVHGRRRVHAIPRTMTFEVEVLRQGEPTWVEMTGHCRERCSVWVDIEVSAARDTYLAQAYTQEPVIDQETGDPLLDPETGQAVTLPVFHHSREVETRYRRDILLAVLEGLQEGEADLLLGSSDGLDILVDLGWFTRPSDTQETPPDPEEEGEETPAPTGAGSSPEPRRSMAASTGST